MRIKGLVKATDTVRAQLRSGIGNSEIQRLRVQVNFLIEAVEGICARRGLTPDHLPTPSRNSYRFLKRLDLNDLRTRAVVKPSTPLGPLKIRNLVKLEGHLADQLWRESRVSSPDSGEESTSLTDILRGVSHVDRICQARASTPSELAPPSRRVYRWLKFLSSPSKIAVHRTTLDRMASAIPNAAGRANPPIRVHLVNMSALWRVRQHGRTILVKINEGFLNAGTAVCEAIVLNCLNRKTPTRNRIIREFAASDEFSEVLLEMESYAEPTTPHVQGSVHNLKESFDRVNDAYFGGSMSRPRLVWNSSPTTRKLGHYQQSLDTVMLSMTLDDAEAPPNLVDFVMYHELLHKNHGTKIVNGRILAHTRQFKADEKRFADYDDVMASLSKLTSTSRRT